MIRIENDDIILDPSQGFDLRFGYPAASLGTCIAAMQVKVDDDVILSIVYTVEQTIRDAFLVDVGATASTNWLVLPCVEE